ncbi:hypothetical protein L1D31_22310 [Vibrio sp. Isolate23]|uniref:hypothetical protein n=1 Tax=Vibrio sp. Isolate23 TaxID=2908533 RepID=UPI001EFE9F43|nr:hypothetical protein [Vibrio sp. Isolate23]MCG9685253.1 hypothetical protein [Vibrio sp. Isolate23]
MNKCVLGLLIYLCSYQLAYGDEINKAERQVATMLTVLEVCKTKSKPMYEKVLDVQLPLILVSASAFGKDATRLILETYPPLATSYLEDPNLNKKITLKFCNNTLFQSNEIVTHYLDKYGKQPLPSWLTTNEFKELLNDLVH